MMGYVLTVCGVVFVLACSVMSALLVADHRDREVSHISRGELLEQTVTSQTLVYCHGCGCNHRLMWMKWHDQCTFRCIVCCGDDDHVDQMLRWR